MGKFMDIDAPPLGVPVKVVADPRYVVGSEIDGESVILLLFSVEHGWIPYSLPRAEAITVAKLLAGHAGEITCH